MIGITKVRCIGGWVERPWNKFNARFEIDGEAKSLEHVANLIAQAPELLLIATAYHNLLRTSAQTEGQIRTFQHIGEVLAKARGLA